MRTDVGIPFSMSILTAFRRSVGGGALGSTSFASASSSVVIVIETVEAVFLRMSTSLVTRLDLVIIWILQLHVDMISRHWRVKPVLDSRFG